MGQDYLGHCVVIIHWVHLLQARWVTRGIPVCSVQCVYAYIDLLDISAAVGVHPVYACIRMRIYDNANFTRIMPKFVVQRSLYEVRERPSKAYSWAAFLIANILVEMPYQILAGIIAWACYY